MIIAKQISKTYLNGQEKIKVIDNFNIEINEKEIISIVGPSGSGKSTLLNILSGIDTVDSGSIYLDGDEIVNMKKTQLSELRLNKLGFVFQTFNLIHSLNVYDNIILPAVIKNKSYDKEYIEELIEILNINHRTNFFPEQLSIGEQQRVAIARALINKPKIIFADEPTGSLDYENSKSVMKLLCECSSKYSNTLVYVTHDMEIAGMADRILEINRGKYLWK